MNESRVSHPDRECGTLIVRGDDDLLDVFCKLVRASGCPASKVDGAGILSFQSILPLRPEDAPICTWYCPRGEGDECDERCRRAAHGLNLPEEEREEVIAPSTWDVQHTHLLRWPGEVAFYFWTISLTPLRVVAEAARLFPKLEFVHLCSDDGPPTEPGMITHRTLEPENDYRQNLPENLTTILVAIPAIDVQDGDEGV